MLRANEERATVFVSCQIQIGAGATHANMEFAFLRIDVSLSVIVVFLTEVKRGHFNF